MALIGRFVGNDLDLAQIRHVRWSQFFLPFLHVKSGRGELWRHDKGQGRRGGGKTQSMCWRRYTPAVASVVGALLLSLRVA